VKTQRASSEIGICIQLLFLWHFSALQTSFNENEDLSGKEIGFVGYGSGSKSKVFAGRFLRTGEK
jgi:hydroxymethylglutaryl-CoA synthase